MTETDTSAGHDLTYIREAIEKSRRDVLDLTLRNQLLNFRPSKRRGVEVVDELSRELFTILVGKKRVMYFLPAPEAQESADASGDPSSDTLGDTPDDVPAEPLALLADPAPDAYGTATRHTDNKLQTALTLATLNLRLRETFRQARLSIEEQGVNILYLVLGMLRWYESDTSTNERRAPLVLIPVRLARSDLRANFKLSWTEDEIEANLSLEAKMKLEFGIRLPEMSAEEDLDVEEYLAAVEKAVAKQRRWSVSRNEIHLNFFSFNKLLIYKDLDPASWPAGSQPADHPLMEQLLGSGGFAHDGSDLGEDPERPGRYLLGIKCDGASYHSARSARDRDRLRQQVLEGLGWRIHRIWSTDWFRDPERELGRVEEAISAARAADVAAPPVPVPVPAKPLERESIAEPEAEPPTRPYELAEVTLGQLREPLHEIAPGRVAKWIAQVVEVESPVHLDEATARIRSAAGKGRSGSRIRNLMKRAANVGDVQRLYRLDPCGFLWRRGQKTADARRRDGNIPPSLRNPAMIAPEEVATALLHVVRASYGIDSSDAVKEAVRLFAFRRSGTKIVHHFRQVLDELVAKGKLEHVGSILRVPESAG